MHLGLHETKKEPCIIMIVKEEWLLSIIYRPSMKHIKDKEIELIKNSKESKDCSSDTAVLCCTI